MIRARNLVVRSAAVVGVALLAAGCTGSTKDSAGDSASSSGSTGGTAAGGSSAPAETSSAAPQVSEAAGPCPYLDKDFIAFTVGQQIGDITVTTTTPAPGPLPRCEFKRASGEAAAIVDTLTIPAGQGLQVALEKVPGGNPVQAGEGGSVLVHKGGAKTELAAFKGTALVLVTINQESSLEAAEIAKEVLKNL